MRHPNYNYKRVNPVTFEAIGDSAIDKARDIEIFKARIEPDLRDGQLRFQFTIRCGLDRSGVSTGGNIIHEDDGVRHYTFRISSVNDLQGCFNENARAAPDMPFVDFLHYIADGMTGAYGSGLGIFQDSYYQVLVSTEALEAFGIQLPSECARTSDGSWILSSRAVKASPYPPEALFDE